MVKTAETYHVPVLLGQSVDGLNIQSGGIYIDVTFGGGGHSSEILSRLDESAHLYSFDQDPDAEQNTMHTENAKEGDDGLGLSYVKQTVKAHNGRASAAVSGGIFTLCITL